jgi:hypothetical protein
MTAAPHRVTVGFVREPFLRYWPDPVALDRVLAVLLLLVAELEAWLTHDAGGHPLLAALVAPVPIAGLAVRRRYPLLAGVAGHTVLAAEFAVASQIEIIATSVAWFCVLYGLTVWTSRRGFLLGAAYVTAVTVVPPFVLDRGLNAHSPSASSRSW